jgi:hypothetical protein
VAFSGFPFGDQFSYGLVQGSRRQPVSFVHSGAMPSHRGWQNRQKHASIKTNVVALVLDQKKTWAISLPEM